jgi:hypothetical protein
MQQVIDGILYSPVNANALRRGDLIRETDAESHIMSWRLLSNPYNDPDRASEDGRGVLLDVARGFAGATYCLPFGINEPVLRAVGAGTSGVL